MVKPQNNYKAVREALQSMQNNAGPFLFYSTVGQVAAKAKCSKTTARKHLNHLCQFRGYSRRSFGRTVGYRYHEEFDN